MNDDLDTSDHLVLAAEDCATERFENLHRFSTRNDRRILTALMAHGPVLLRGGRGTGKSAFMISASMQMDPHSPKAAAVGLYMSLRHAPLLKSTGENYGRILCRIVINKIRESLGARAADFNPDEEVGALQTALMALAQTLKKRIVLFFDDAAHLGREASLEEFFDIYRTLSSNAVSCKAAIYPGVTSFGTRFDVYNDASVVDLLRSEEMPGFADTFEQVMTSRFPSAFGPERFRTGFDRKAVAAFLAQATLGNMRGFVIACGTLQTVSAGEEQVGFNELTKTLIELARNHYWPLLEEIEPKLGRYQPMVRTARELAASMFSDCAKRDHNPRDVVIHRDLDEAFAKPLQILEYAGFVSKREASMGMKQGGRGARYALNLCNLLEETKGSRLTKELFGRWTTEPRAEAVQFNKSNKLFDIQVPQPDDSANLAILSADIGLLKRSNAYPYGLTDLKIDVLRSAGLTTIGELAEADDKTLDSLRGINQGWILRIRNVLGQAIWM